MSPLASRIFLVVLVVASVISHMIARSVQRQRPRRRSTGRSGFVFGLARGAVLVCAGLSWSATG